MFKPAERLNLPGYPFAELERQATAIKASGQPLYDLSIGDPDLPPPKFVVDAVHNALDDPRSHLYPSSRGDYEVRCSVAQWFEGRFGVKLDPDKQVCIIIGAKEGLGQIARAVVNPGDIVAVPEPAYPVYSRAGCKLVDGIQLVLQLDPENGFLPDLSKVKNVKLLYLNYPNNPTGAEVTDDFLMELGKLANANPEMTLVYDMAYSEMCYNRPARSILEFTPNAIEFHSLSKMACATGYRVGFAVGDPDRIAALIRIKEEIDSGVPLPFQKALSAMLDSFKGNKPPTELLEYRRIFSNRKRMLSKALEEHGFYIFRSQATFYVWFKVGDDELPFISNMLKQGVLLTPGSGFGNAGKGWVRASVTSPDEVIQGAIEIIREVL
ncbi:MAG: aminotransferase class I/II-fold pyridoxal phosphate-dependent enzyme [Candidatus Hatepunaea meridiana]|nr:aminotransferase class I/II-fold pyridoxal phosphate-dependent enzyme [Candidatus Hatepunaea meridiana]